MAATHTLIIPELLIDLDRVQSLRFRAPVLLNHLLQLRDAGASDAKRFGSLPTRSAIVVIEDSQRRTAV
jgi:hypothetical protein